MTKLDFEILAVVDQLGSRCGAATNVLDKLKGKAFNESPF